MKTTLVKAPAPKWHLVDAAGLSLGRLSSKIATMLRGKHRASFAPHQFSADHIVVINAKDLKFGERKLIQKTYRTHSGYLGHMREQSLQRLMEKKPEAVIEMAVKGMLPHNRLRTRMMKHLHVFPGAEHTHTAQQPAPLTLPRS